jgi:hypothetical protein
MCGPRGLPGAVDSAYRNNGDGTFTDVTAAAGLLEEHPRYGLGVAVGDYDNDGWPDLTKSNFAFENTNLYHNEKGGHFSDQSGSVAGIAVLTYPLVKWGTKFLDYDNDGWKDLVVVNWHVYPYLRRSPAGGETYEQRRLLFRNLGNGKFADVSKESGPGILQERSSRGLAVGDLDNDGDLDVVVVNIDSTPSILRNDGGNRRSWLSVRLRGRASNRLGLGARITAVTPELRQIAEATTAGSIFSASDSRVHFGLGSATEEDLEIRWPSGKVQTESGAGQPDGRGRRSGGSSGGLGMRESRTGPSGPVMTRTAAPPSPSNDRWRSGPALSPRRNATNSPSESGT